MRSDRREYAQSADVRSRSGDGVPAGREDAEECRAGGRERHPVGGGDGTPARGGIWRVFDWREVDAGGASGRGVAGTGCGRGFAGWGGAESAALSSETASA